MIVQPTATWLLEQETRALLTRLMSVKPFALQETCVAAAAISPAAQTGIEQHLFAGRREVRRRALEFIRWLRGEGRDAPAAEQQRRFWILRLNFHNALAQLDLFSEVITQRSENETGVLLAGLDVAAAEALLIPGDYFQAPPVICQVHRGLGGAIRRARTRLPGGGDNPVSIIRIPRERMVGYGIASSLVHEVGHQGAALLGLVESLRASLQRLRSRGDHRLGWTLWERWISEIVADFWSICKVGIGSTLGLIGLVSLPRRFVFRCSTDDPHPFPWIRVLLSCAIGQRMYPDPQWGQLAGVWQAMYPTDDLAAGLVGAIEDLRATLPEFVSLLVDHRPRSLRGRSLGAVLYSADRHPDRLVETFYLWRAMPDRMSTAPPTLAFAVVGQARARGLITPEREGRQLRELITGWAVVSALETARAIARTTTPMPLGQPAIWRLDRTPRELATTR